MSSYLSDGVAVVNLNLIRGIDKTITITFDTTDDISGWTLEAAFYDGTHRHLIETTNTTNNLTKTVTMVFVTSEIDPFYIASYPWDIRYNTGADKGQILKGLLSLEVL